jgi:hypothetical protein
MKPVRGQTSVCLIAAWGLLLVMASSGGAEEPFTPLDVADDQLKSWIDHHVEQLQPTEDDRALDNIGWVTEILEAQKLAAQHQRPVFLFTHDGRMAIGRC